MFRNFRRFSGIRNRDPKETASHVNYSSPHPNFDSVQNNNQWRLIFLAISSGIGLFTLYLLDPPKKKQPVSTGGVPKD